MQELQAIGVRRKQLLEEADAEMDRLAAFLSVATSAGIRQTEIAERVGVSRQTLVNLRSEGRSQRYEWSLDVQLMVALAFQGPQTITSLTSLVPSVVGDEEPILSAINRLKAAGTVAWAGAAISGDERRLDYFKLTTQGAEELPGRLRQAAIPENKRWTAYVRTSNADVEVLADIGQSILGEYQVGVIPANTVRGMQDPEVAFYVEAPTFHDAITKAAEFYEMLRARAGLDPEAARVSALVPPDAGARPSGAFAGGGADTAMASDFRRLRAEVEVQLQATPATHGPEEKDLLELANRIPAAAIIEAHLRIEQTLRQILSSAGIETSDSEATAALVGNAITHGLITPATANAVEGATVMRNLAVHGPRRDVSTKQAVEYVTIAAAALYAIRQNAEDQSR